VIEILQMNSTYNCVLLQTLLEWLGPPGKATREYNLKIEIVKPVEKGTLPRWQGALFQKIRI